MVTVHAGESVTSDASSCRDRPRPRSAVGLCKDRRRAGRFIVRHWSASTPAGSAALVFRDVVKTEEGRAVIDEVADVRLRAVRPAAGGVRVPACAARERCTVIETVRAEAQRYRVSWRPRDADGLPRETADARRLVAVPMVRGDVVRLDWDAGGGASRGGARARPSNTPCLLAGRVVVAGIRASTGGISVLSLREAGGLAMTTCSSHARADHACARPLRRASRRWESVPVARALSSATISSAAPGRCKPSSRSPAIWCRSDWGASGLSPWTVRGPTLFNRTCSNAPSHRLRLLKACTVELIVVPQQHRKDR